MTVIGLLALAVLTLFYKQDIGFVSITIGPLLTLMAPGLQKRALGQVLWPEIMLIVGVSTYVGVLQKMGTIDFVGHIGTVGFIAAMAVSSTIVDVSPFSTNGALVLANTKEIDRDTFFRQLMVYGAIVTVVAPVLVWLLFVVL